MSDTKYLAEIADPDHIDYDDALSAEDLAASLAPEMEQDARRWNMIIRAATTPEIEEAADVIGHSLEIEMGGRDVADPKELMRRLMDRLIERFGDEP